LENFVLIIGVHVTKYISLTLDSQYRYGRHLATVRESILCLYSNAGTVSWTWSVVRRTLLFKHSEE
jgi:hypothetical protein